MNIESFADRLVEAGPSDEFWSQFQPGDAEDPEGFWQDMARMASQQGSSATPEVPDVAPSTPVMDPRGASTDPDDYGDIGNSETDPRAKAHTGSSAARGYVPDPKQRKQQLGQALKGFNPDKTRGVGGYAARVAGYPLAFAAAPLAAPGAAAKAIGRGVAGAARKVGGYVANTPATKFAKDAWGGITRGLNRASVPIGFGLGGFLAAGSRAAKNYDWSK